MNNLNTKYKYILINIKYINTINLVMKLKLTYKFKQLIETSFTTTQ